MPQTEIREPFLTECNECDATIALERDPGYEIICKMCSLEVVAEMRP